MSLYDKCVTIDNPNFLPSSDRGVPMGKMVNMLPAAYPLPEGCETLSISDLYLPQVSLRIMEGMFTEKTAFINQSNTGAELIASCIILQGKFNTKVSSHDEGVWTYGGYQSLKYDPRNEYTHFLPAHTAFHVAHLSVDPALLFDLLPEGEWWSDDLRDRIVRKDRVLSSVPPAISQAQHKALQNIFNCPLEGKLGMILMETSIIQLLLLQLHLQFQRESRAQCGGISRRDEDFIHSVKAHLDKTFLEDHTLSELARQFGTNSNKLMSLFKRVFGTSIFDHIAEMKMDYAKSLLEDEGLFVTEVSHKLGYKNPHHFSAAFKKKFGVCPSTLKQAS